ncbi:probable G2/mitotic-specific cyclin B [Serendipita indica DSM 11827]|uniref:Probable G2/mitotic-specific cyclin B n=1 Tax=Serendipita indica (strain DSM 11827) TaxID=1109443 RepID=G4TYC6_SERID|nr:probable G2/mitotic-specific cyclin B [Serendipita indica DSM 11827]
MTTGPQNPKPVTEKRKSEPVDNAKGKRRRIHASQEPEIKIGLPAAIAEDPLRAARQPLLCKNTNKIATSPTTKANTGSDGTQTDAEKPSSLAVLPQHIREHVASPESKAKTDRSGDITTLEGTAPADERTRSQAVDEYASPIRMSSDLAKIVEIAGLAGVDDDKSRLTKQRHLVSPDHQQGANDREVNNIKLLTGLGKVAQDPEIPTRVRRSLNPVEVSGPGADILDQLAKPQTPHTQESKETSISLSDKFQNDPSMEHEYVEEILKNLRERENMTIPRQPDMDDEFKSRMHRFVGEQLVTLHQDLGLLPEILFRAIHLLDRFLSVEHIHPRKHDLLGAACLFIATKVEEGQSVHLQRFLPPDSKVEDFKQMEACILGRIEYTCTYPTPLDFLQPVSKITDFGSNSRSIANYLVEIYCVESELSRFLPSYISGAAMWLARFTLDRREWTADLAHWVGYNKETLLPCANVMLNHILSDPWETTVYDKYASPEFDEVSTYIRLWATARWGKGSRVDLLQYLNGLDNL